MNGDLPWYGEGLAFSCTQCGRCCTGAPGWVWVTRAEIDEMAEYLGASRAQFRRDYLRRSSQRFSLIERANGDCVFFERRGDEGGCRVYPVRPTQCRTYPFWREFLRSRRAWEGVLRTCPGAGSGRHYAMPEIERIARGEGETGG